MSGLEESREASTKARLLVLTSTFPDGLDNRVPRFVLDLCLALESEFNVDVLTPHVPGSACKEVLGTITVHRYRYCFEWAESLAGAGGILGRLKAQPARWLLLPLFLLGQWLALYRLLTDRRYDLIHAHWVLPQALMAVLVCRLLLHPPKIVCTLHGADLFALKSRLANVLRNFLLARCHAVTVVSPTMAETLNKCGAALPALRVIPMGTDFTHTFRPLPAIERCSQSILFVGRLVEKKGLPLLLAAMPHVLARYPKAELTVVGDGPEKTSAVSLARTLGVEANVRWAGWLAHEQLAACYQQATAVVFPFVTASNGDREGFGLVVVEAMGCECPVIVSAIPALEGTVQDRVNGIVLPSLQAEHIAAAILLLLDRPDCGAAWGARARQHVVARFGWDRVRQDYAALLHEVLEGTVPCLPST